jgi:transposase
MTIQILGIDLAKNVFQLHGVNRSGHAVFKRRVMRDQLLAVLAQVDPCTVVVEACTGAFYWARKFEVLGHKVKIISPQYVKPFVRRQKNDGNDAEAICTAARQPDIPFVPKKSVEQQDIQATSTRRHWRSGQPTRRPAFREKRGHISRLAIPDRRRSGAAAWAMGRAPCIRDRVW